MWPGARSRHAAEDSDGEDGLSRAGTVGIRRRGAHRRDGAPYGDVELWRLESGSTERSQRRVPETLLDLLLQALRLLHLAVLVQRDREVHEHECAAIETRGPDECFLRLVQLTALVGEDGREVLKADIGREQLDCLAQIRVRFAQTTLSQ